jgi:hypothetical protein
LFLLLFLCAVVLAQTESLANQHLHQHSGNQHCCALCHAGPLPFLQTAGSAAISPQLTVVWIAGIFETDAPHDIFLSDGSSRAPPSLSAFPAS